jgi:hypothetical protein
MQIILSAMNSTVPIDASGCDTVMCFKKKVEETFGVGVDQQCLIFAGKQLIDCRMLSGYENIHHGTVLLTLQLSGGRDDLEIDQMSVSMEANLSRQSSLLLREMQSPNPTFHFESELPTSNLGRRDRTEQDFYPFDLSGNLYSLPQFVPNKLRRIDVVSGCKDRMPSPAEANTCEKAGDPENCFYARPTYHRRLIAGVEHSHAESPDFSNAGIPASPASQLGKRSFPDKSSPAAVNPAPVRCEDDRGDSDINDEMAAPVTKGRRGLAYDASRVGDERLRRRLLKNRASAERSRLRKQAAEASAAGRLRAAAEEVKRLRAEGGELRRQIAAARLLLGALAASVPPTATTAAAATAPPAPTIRPLSGPGPLSPAPRPESKGAMRTRRGAAVAATAAGK